MRTRLIGAATAVCMLAGAAPAMAQTTMTQPQVERRYNVRLVSSVLVNAARHGAELMGLRVQQIDPGIILLSGTSPRAEGFVIDGHGVFFHVEIPDVDPVVAWAVTNRGRDQAAVAAINRIRNFVQVSDVQAKQELEAELRRLEQRFAVPQRASSTEPGGMPPAPTAAAPRAMDNPDLEYEKLVTDQLVNAMIDHSHQLGLAADEWLTIAARGSQGPLVPSMVFQDTVTITLRVKGGDLADYRAGRLTRDEVRARVVVREF